MPGPGEEVWTEEDVEYALEWKAVTGSECSGCGEPRSESFDPANETSYQATLLVCHACAARESKARKFQEDGGDTAGLVVSVRRR